LKGGYSLYFLIMTELDFSDLIYFEACTAAWGLHNYTSEIFCTGLEQICFVYMIMKEWQEVVTLYVINCVTKLSAWSL
jgi:hypothetical protein